MSEAEKLRRGYRSDRQSGNVDQDGERGNDAGDEGRDSGEIPDVGFPLAWPEIVVDAEGHLRLAAVDA